MFDKDGKQFALEVRTGSSEAELLRALSECVQIAMNAIEIEVERSCLTCEQQPSKSGREFWIHAKFVDDQTANGQIYCEKPAHHALFDPPLIHVREQAGK